jgi:hypothetical protein
VKNFSRDNDFVTASIFRFARGMPKTAGEKRRGSGEREEFKKMPPQWTSMAKNAVFDQTHNKGEQPDNQNPESPLNRQDHARGQNRADQKPDENNEKKLHAPPV